MAAEQGSLCNSMWRLACCRGDPAPEAKSSTTPTTDGSTTTPNDAKQPAPSTTSNICDRVRETCAAYVANHTNHVTINRSAIPALAEEIQAQTKIVWDKEAWHYQPPKEWPAELQKERLALYIIAMDAINFCFWPQPGYEYSDLATTLTSIAEEDHEQQAQDLTSMSLDFALLPGKLATMTACEMTRLFAKHHPKKLIPPDMADRCRMWNEVGQVIMYKYRGSALTMINFAKGSAAKLVATLADVMQGFCDFNAEIAFLKRAQICVGDWNAALQLELSGMEQLTTFADYRVPQLLRDKNILEYKPDLATKVDAQEELAQDSEEEWSIRAATVVAVEWLVQELQTRDASRTWTAVETDWYLWQVGERDKDRLRPHHRVRTIYY